MKLWLICSFNQSTLSETPLIGFLAEDIVDVNLRVKQAFLTEQGYVDEFIAEPYKEGEKWTFNAFSPASESGMQMVSFCVIPVHYRDF